MSLIREVSVPYQVVIFLVATSVTVTAWIGGWLIEVIYRIEQHIKKRK